MSKYRHLRSAIVMIGVAMLLATGASTSAAQGVRVHPALHASPDRSPDRVAAAGAGAIAEGPAAPRTTINTGRQDDVLFLDDGDDSADDFFGFTDGSPFFWANRFRLGGQGYLLEGIAFYMRTEQADRNAVYLAVLNEAGEKLAEGTVEYDLAPDGGWFTATLDPSIAFEPGDVFFLEVGNASRNIAFPAGIDNGVLGAQAEPAVYIASSEQTALEAAGTGFERDAFLIRAFGTLRQDNAAPTIVHQQSAALAQAGAPLTVTATISDDDRIARAVLLYEEGGRGTTNTVEMSASSGVYQGTIPASAVTARGVRYAVEAEDSEGLTARTPWMSKQVRIDGNGLTQALGWGDGSYRLVSVPLMPDAPGSADVLADDLGPYDVNNWRFYGLDAAQSYTEHPRAGSMVPGRAFWLALRERGLSFDTGPGTSSPLDGPVVIDLHAGWNFVGTPFSFDVPRAQVRLASGGALDLRRFDGDWSAHTGALRPFEGYAVFVPAADKLQIWPTTDALSAAAPAVASPLQWSVRFVAETMHARDANNVAAVAAGASAGWDAADRAEPPPVGAYVSAYFSAPDAAAVTSRLSQDVRAPDAAEQVWTLHVETGQQEEVRLHAPSLAGLDASLGVWLTDMETGQRQDLRMNPVYTFASRAATPRAFLVTVGPHERTVAEQARTTLALFPNPVRSSATIRLGLAARGAVRLSLHDALGREVAVLVDGTLDGGMHTIPLDAVALASGPYYLRLTTDTHRVTHPFVRLR